MFLGVAVLMIFAAIVGLWSFLMPNVDNNTQVDSYATNMVIWHQGAMMQVSENAKTVGYFSQCNSQTPTTSDDQLHCSQNISSMIYNSANNTPAKGSLAKYWPGYKSLLSQNNLRGWQSWLARLSTSQDFYVITLLPPQKPLPLGSYNAVGSLSKIETDLANSIRGIFQDQTGVGQLKCNNINGGNCQQYYLNYTDPKIDLNNNAQSSIIPNSVIDKIALANSINGQKINLVGATVIMTHVQTPK